MTEEQKHNAVAHDQGIELGEHPIGELVHISTVTHAFRGVLLDVTPSYYILSTEHPIALVDSTGPFSEYFNTPLAAREGDEWIPSESKSKVGFRVARGAVSWMTSFGRP